MYTDLQEEIDEGQFQKSLSLDTAEPQGGANPSTTCKSNRDCAADSVCVVQMEGPIRLSDHLRTVLVSCVATTLLNGFKITGGNNGKRGLEQPSTQDR